MSEFIERKEFEDKIDHIYTCLEQKVSWKNFTWILSTILGLYVIISAALWMDLRDMKAQINNLSMAVNKIETILTQAEMIK